MEASEDDDHLLKLRLMERAKRQTQLLTGLYPKAGAKLDSGKSINQDWWYTRGYQPRNKQ